MRHSKPTTPHRRPGRSGRARRVRLRSSLLPSKSLNLVTSYKPPNRLLILLSVFLILTEYKLHVTPCSSRGRASFFPHSSCTWQRRAPQRAPKFARRPAPPAARRRGRRPWHLCVPWASSSGLLPLPEVPTTTRSAPPRLLEYRCSTGPGPRIFLWSQRRPASCPRASGFGEHHSLPMRKASRKHELNCKSTLLYHFACLLSSFQTAAPTPQRCRPRLTGGVVRRPRRTRRYTKW
mmetsp:Transcript_1246/g.2818  ORF Transcript_1246/g.2818 Transcript_1246/m.2818 type:complete len:235 (-) Transcript_1246:2737-3441(-)